MVKAQVNVVLTGGSREETKPIDCPISFPPVNPNRVIVPYYDALLTPPTPAWADEGGTRLYWDSLLAFSDIGGPKSYN